MTFGKRYGVFIGWIWYEPAGEGKSAGHSSVLNPVTKERIYFTSAEEFTAFLNSLPLTSKRFFDLNGTLKCVNPRHYKVLGTNYLRLVDKRVAPERKTAAILTYLALDGPTPRSRIAGLLWPNAQEATARNNLSQALRRLRQTVGEDLIIFEDALRLSNGLEVDAAQLKLAALSGKAETVAAYSGDLLAPLDYDDLPEFSEWLWSAREELHALRKDALESLVTSFEARGDFKKAQAYAERLLELEPISEVAYRHIMRLLYLLGDRPAALRAYARCKKVLIREAGVEPLPETKDLALLIEQGGVQPSAAASSRGIPLAILRPPILVGREQAWQKMEEAWGAGQGIILGGAPGVGKTRLALDFAASKGPFLLFGGRPSDSSIPYSSHTRNYRQTLAAHPNLVLEPWVRRELARMLPELGESPGPISSEAEKLYFYQAKAHVLQRIASEESLIIVSDDIQYVDLASSEAGAYVFSQFWGELDSGLRSIICYRTGELRPELEPLVQNLVSAGLAVHIELEPLATNAVGELLETLHVPEASGLGDAMTRYTGGNPLFILETIKHLIETGRLSESLPIRLPPPGKVGPVVLHRLERLSPLALRIAQAAAVLQDNFGSNLIADMLNLSTLELLGPWDELEKAQVFVANGFAHDLIYEAVCSSTSPSVSVLLHQRAAEVMAERGVEPLRVAQHWFEAGDEEKSIPFLLQAASLAEAEYRLSDADELYTRAANILNDLGREEQRQQVLAAKAELSTSTIV